MAVKVAEENNMDADLAKRVNAVAAAAAPSPFVMTSSTLKSNDDDAEDVSF